MEGQSIGNEFNAANMLSNKYSQSTQFFSAMDERKARKEGEKIGKAIAEGMEDALQSIDDVTQILDKTLKSFLTNARSNTKEAGKEWDNYKKSLEEILPKFEELKSSMSAENDKAEKDLTKVVELENQRINLISDAVILMSKESTEVSKINALEMKANAEKAIRDEKDEKARQKAITDYTIARTLLEDIGQAELNITNEVKESAQGTLELLDKVGESLDKGKFSFSETISSIKDGIGTLKEFSDSLFNVSSTWRDEFGSNRGATQINRWSQDTDRYFNAYNDISRTLGVGRDGATFNTLKNDIIDGMTQGIGNIYNDKQQEALLREIAGFNFTSTETAVAMAKDIAYAKEYMGLSSESLRDMYSLQVRSGDDTFMKKTLNSIVALQKAGITIDEQQLATMIDNSLSVTEAMANMGMDGEAQAELMTQLTALQLAGNEVSPGYGDQLFKAANDFLTGDLDTLAEYGIQNPEAIYRQVKETGDITPFINALYGSNASQTYAGLAQGDYGLGDKAISGMLGDKSALYSQMDQGSYNKVMDQFNKEMDLIRSDPEAYEKDIRTTEEIMADEYKDMNAKVTKWMEEDWKTLSEGVAKQEYWASVKEDIDGKFNLLNSLVGAILAAVSVGQLFMKDGNGLGTQLIGKIGGGGTTGSGGMGLGTKIFGSAATSGTLANRLSQGVAGGKLGIKGAAGTTGGAIAGGLAVAGGIVAAGDMLYDGISTGVGGFKDSSGQKIEGTGGLGDGVAAAFTDGTIHDSAVENVGGGALSGLGKGAAIGAAIGTIIPGVGTVVGGLVGGAIGGLGGLLSGMHKDNKRQEQLALKEQQKQTQILESTKTATEAIKASRDAELTNRYEDDRWGTGSIPFNAPTVYGKGSTSDWVTSSKYGAKDVDGVSSHNGIDFTGKPYGTPIGSAANGIVVNVVDGNTWKDSDIAGGKYNANYVDVYNEQNGITYRYYHLAGSAVSVGQSVGAGEVIGYMGNTGNVRPIPTDDNPTAGTHLHLSTYKNGAYIDPSSYVTSSIFDTKPILSSYVPDIKTNKVSKGSDSTMLVDSPSIIRSLGQINDTLLAIDKRQSDQQKILDALTNTPIHNLGV